MDHLNSTDTFESNNEELTEIEDNKKSIITFSKLNKYFLIPFLCPIFCALTNLFMDLVYKEKVINKFDFFSSVSTDLSFIFAGLFYFVPHFKANYNKKNYPSSNNETNNSGIIYIYNEGIINNYHPCKIIMLIILLSLIIVIDNLFYIFISDKNVFEKRLYFLIFIPLFSKIILKVDIYKHQYFSLIIAIGGIIFLLIPVCFELNTEDIIPNILNVICGIIYPLFLVIIKYLSEKYYISPLKISLLLGIMSLFFDCIGYIIYSLIKYNDLSYFNDFFNFSEEKNKFIIIVYIILFILFYVTLQLFILLVLFYFSPILLLITDIISPFLSWIFDNILEPESIPNVILEPIGYLIVIFSALIYNEIIIFNFCGLNKNTKKFVNKRNIKELEDIKNTQDALLYDDD